MAIRDDIFLLRDRVVVVTGAGQGIGRAIAAGAARLGASVVAVDVSPSGLETLPEELGDAPVELYSGDVASSRFCTEIVERALGRFGAIHALVNNAGIVRAAMIHKMTDQEWQDVLSVNLTGAFYLLREVGRHMLDRTKSGSGPAGSIVNIASDAGRRGTIGQVNYGASKAGLLGLTMSAAREWGRYGIRVNTIAFGMVETAMTEKIRGEQFRDTYLAQIPFRRWASADEVTPPVLFLLSDAASYITGQHLSVNGGFHIST